MKLGKKNIEIMEKVAEAILPLTDEQINEIHLQYSLLNNSILNEREYGENEYTARNRFQRDYSRILYSPSFRRLQGKMQIIGIKSSAFYRNRLTHSLEVSQIATSIARSLAISCNRIQKMYTDDIYLIEAAALAHDIGHPAFGHKGEQVLNELAKKNGLHFEGNAQNFRVLRYLEKKEPGHKGLNLTPRTLLAINKYIIDEKKGTNKFMYSSDYNYLMTIRKKIHGMGSRRTLDVQIIEIADDIAYAVHDLEDGLSLRNFSIDEILFLLRNKSQEAYNLFIPIVKNAIKYSNNKEENVQNHSKLFRMSLTSQLTNIFINDITIKEITKEEAKEHGTEIYKELTLDKYKTLLKHLKKVVFECTLRNNEVHLYEIKGEIILKSLFLIYTNIRTNKDGKLMPPDFRPDAKFDDINNNKSKIKEYYKDLSQKAIDYIAGMMDTFAIQEYEKLFNKSFSNINLTEISTINKLLEKNTPSIKHGFFERVIDKFFNRI